jgi:hypothetical protein
VWRPRNVVVGRYSQRNTSSSGSSSSICGKSTANIKCEPAMRKRMFLRTVGPEAQRRNRDLNQPRIPLLRGGWTRTGGSFLSIFSGFSEKSSRGTSGPHLFSMAL